MREFFKRLANWWRGTPAPTTPTDPDPVLPAVTLVIPYGKDKQQYLTVYIPARRASERVAIVVIVHGGGWWQGDADAPNVVQAKKDWLLPQGIAFGSIGYRLGTKSTPKIWPDMEAQDVADACAYLRAHADEYGLDMDRFVLLAFSAGGHLGALGITSLGIEAAGFVGMDSAVYNVPKGMKGPHPADPFDIAFGSDPAYWAKCDPIGHMKSAPPPMLLVTGTVDRGPADLSQANEFAAKARTFNVQADVIEVALPHGDINGKLGTTADPVSAAYTDQVMAFIRRCIGN